MSKLSISIIGAGNVATHLGLALKQTPCNIKQVYSRQMRNAQALAMQLKAQGIDNVAQLNADVDVIIMAVTDKALLQLLPLLPVGNALVLHTAGSVDMDVLARFPNHGVLYPFQTFSKNKEVEMRNVPFLVEGSDNHQLETIKTLASTLSSRVMEATSQQRMHLHMAAVFCCNFVNHMYTVANQLLTDNQLPFDLLLPLIEETTQKIKTLAPMEAQTGPAVRGDLPVIEKHLSQINDLTLHDIYKLMSQNIINKHKATK